jgi:hypothetical protein
MPNGIPQNGLAGRTATIATTARPGAKVRAEFRLPGPPKLQGGIGGGDESNRKELGQYLVTVHCSWRWFFE